MNLNKGKISVVVPVYNVEKYLRRCLDSIINQTYKDLEIILVDDGSSDSSGMICDEYAKRDNRVIVIHQENQGVSAARNAGIDCFSGDYICFPDSDDYYSEDFCETMHDALIAKKADMAICRIVRFNGERCEKIPSWSGAYKILSPYEAIKNIYVDDGETYILTGNKLFKRSVVENVRYPVGKINEDEATTYKYFLNSEKILFIDKVMNFYYKNDKSITSDAEYYKNMDIYYAYDERKHILKNRNDMEELVCLTSKAYLDRIVYRCRFLQDKEVKRKLYIRYKEYYKENKDEVKGFGYKLYNFSPKLYYFLLELKK